MFVNPNGLYFPHLIKFQVTLFIFCSFRHIHHTIIYSWLFLQIYLKQNISNNFIYLTSINCYSFFLIVTIKYLNQSFAVASHNLDFDKFSSSICILVARIIYLSQFKIQYIGIYFKYFYHYLYILSMYTKLTKKS